MPKQCQVIAIEKGSKNTAKKAITDAYHKIQKRDLFSGMVRSYTPNDEEGDKLPTETKHVQVRAMDLINAATEAWIDLFDVSAMKEYTNCEAKADVIIDDVVLLKQVPVGYLLFLEKQVQDVVTFLKKMPILDPAERWKWDSAEECFATEPIDQLRTKKVAKPIVLHPATKEHPAQTQMITEDVPVGTWKTRKFSGCLEQEKISEFLNRATKLQRALKFAREEANTTEATRHKNGEKIFSYLFGAQQLPQAAE